MKKNKSKEQSSAEFKNHPFKSLKGFAPTHAPAEKKTSTAPVREVNLNNPEDDASLFLRAVDGAKRMGPEPGPSAPALKQTDDEKSAAGKPEDKQLFLQAMRTMGATFRDKAPERKTEESVHRAHTGRMRQLKRGTIRISQELDLHGFLKDEAVMQLERFIIDAFRQGQTAVLVITGKGINSPEGPVLQGAVAEWLRQRGSGMVSEFSPAPRDRGGSGAFVVFLKEK
jgi:DNA-nicking Smr family endonuclease